MESSRTSMSSEFSVERKSSGDTSSFKTVIFVEPLNNKRSFLTESIEASVSSISKKFENSDFNDSADRTIFKKKKKDTSDLFSVESRDSIASNQFTNSLRKCSKENSSVNIIYSSSTDLKDKINNIPPKLNSSIDNAVPLYNTFTKIDQYENSSYGISQPNSTSSLIYDKEAENCFKHKFESKFSPRVCRSTHSGLNISNKNSAKKSNSETSFNSLNSYHSNPTIRHTASSTSSLDKKKGKIFSFEDIRFSINDDQLDEFRKHMLRLFKVRS